MIAGSASLAIVLIKSFLIMKQIIVFFGRFTALPLWRLFRGLAIRLAVRLYTWQARVARSLGWKKGGAWDRTWGHPRFIHALVALVALVLVFDNLTTKTGLAAVNEQSGRTVIDSLVQSEFEGEEAILVEEFFDAEQVISPAQQHYLDSLTIPTDPIGSRAIDDMADDPAIAQGGALVKPDIASTEYTKRQREGVINHTVRPGDTVSSIAQEYDVNVSTILWENNLSAYSIIRPGDQVAILPVSGITHKVAKGDTLSAIAKKYNISEAEIAAMNKLAGGVLEVGAKLIVPGGAKSSYVAYSQPTKSGLNVIRDLVKPSNSKPSSGNKMNWPTEGYRITQYYSWKHYAVDVANKVGTPIYAADAGTIETIGWGKGYGNQIVIDHGGGKKTRYAHLSKFYAKKGQQVAKGETIGAMGSTGWSTGSHLHFEIIINGKKLNPLNYVK